MPTIVDQPAENAIADIIRWDVVVFRTRDLYDRGDLFTTDPPIRSRLSLGHEVFVERIDGGVARQVSAACSAGGIENSTAQVYSFVRAFNGDQDPKDFDEDQRLQTTIALSRLVRPTSVGLEESAQVWGSMVDGATPSIRPGPITGPASEAYVADLGRGDWLTPSDGLELKQLLNEFMQGGIPDRVMRGLWHHENAARALDMSARWTSVATGLEALFNTDRQFVTRQFKVRCADAASELGIALSVKDAGEAYVLRSRLAHGSMTRVAAGTLQLYVALEQVLRESLKRGISGEWRQRLYSDDTVRAAWPVAIPTECPQCGRSFAELGE